MKKNGFAAIIFVILAAFALVAGFVLISNSRKAPGKNTSDQSKNLVAMGASFTKANNLSPKLTGDNPEYSFATGTKIESVYLYLKSMDKNLAPRNLAESGANSQKVLANQVPNAISYHPKYVLIDITADIFEEETPAKLKENLKEIASRLKNQDTTILIGNYPNLIAMRKADFPVCSQDKLGLGIGKITEDKLKLFNKAIAEAAKEGNLILVDNFNTLGPNEVSDYDCLHPNIEGQKKTAKVWIEAVKRGR